MEPTPSLEDALETVDVESFSGYPLDIVTAAPVIGRVMPAAGRSPRPGHEPRVPDVMADGLQIGSYSVAGASLIGIGHSSQGGGRQDSYAFGLDPHGRLYVAVADGLGSRPLSQLGSRLFCEELMRCAANHADDELRDPAHLIAEAAERAKDIVEGVYGGSARDAACVTVVGVFAGPKHTIARVGDCTAFSLDADGFTELFADDGTFINLVRTALLDGSVGNVEQAEPNPAAALVLCSDGLANDLRTSPTLRAWLQERWQRPTTAFALLDSLRYRRQGSHDDRTAVVIWPDVDPGIGTEIGAEAVGP